VFSIQYSELGIQHPASRMKTELNNEHGIRVRARAFGEIKKPPSLAAHEDSGEQLSAPQPAGQEAKSTEEAQRESRGFGDRDPLDVDVVEVGNLRR